MLKNSKWITFATLSIVLIVVAAGFFVRRVYELNLSSTVAKGEAAELSHFVHIEMVSSAGSHLYELGFKVGFANENMAQHFQKAIPRVKNDILMLDLAEEIGTFNMHGLKSKLTDVVCRNCPQAGENVYLDFFLTL